MTEFSQEELKLISRALNAHAKRDEKWNTPTEGKEATDLASRIYRENFRIGVPND